MTPANICIRSMLLAERRSHVVAPALEPPDADPHLRWCGSRKCNGPCDRIGLIA